MFTSVLTGQTLVRYFNDEDVAPVPLINTNNDIIQKIQADLEAGKTTPETEDLVNMVFDQACIWKVKN